MFGSNFDQVFGIPAFPMPSESSSQPSPLANTSPLSAADQSAMSPETFSAVPQSQLALMAGKDVNILQGAANTLMAPGRALASKEPITSEEMIKPAVDIAGMTTLGAGAIPAEANVLRAGASVPKSSGFQALEDARFKAEQGYIKENLPPPTSHLPPVEYVKHYTKNMAPDQILESDALWAKARDIQDVSSQKLGSTAPFSKAFSELAETVLGRPLTAKEFSKAMTDAAQAGIGK